MNACNIQGFFSESIAGYLFSLLGSFSLAIYIIVSSKCLKDVKNMTQSFWTSLCGTVFSIIASAIFEHPVFPEVASDWLLVCGHAFSVAFLGILLIVSVSLVGPLIVALLKPLHLVLMFILQVTLMKEFVKEETSILNILGKACIKHEQKRHSMYTLNFA